MSFEDTSDAFIWRCDGCDKIAEFPAHDFWRAVAELKARNWKFTRDAQGTEYDCWMHLCSKCRPKAATNVADFLARKPRASRES
jgi:hypothetical protein